MGAESGTPVQSTTSQATPQASPETTVAPVTETPVNPVTPGTQAPQPAESVAPVLKPGQRDPGLLARILNGEDPVALGLETAPAASPAAAETLTGQQQETAPATTPTTQMPQQTQELILGKFKSLEDLTAGYQQLEKRFGEQRNELGTLRQQVQQPAQQPTETPAQATPATPAEEAPKFPWEVEMTPEQKEAALEEYYADPLTAQAKRDQQTMKAMEHMVKQMVSNAIEPLQPVAQKFQEDQQVQHFSEAIEDYASQPGNEDFYELEPQIEQIYNQFGDSILQLPNAVEVLHMMARGLTAKAEPAPSAPTHDEILADPGFRQKVLADPGLQKEIAAQYAKQIASGAPPVLMGAQPGGTPVAAPTEKPRSIKEASAIFLRNMGH